MKLTPEKIIEIELLLFRTSIIVPGVLLTMKLKTRESKTLGVFTTPASFLSRVRLSVSNLLAISIHSLI